MSEGGVQKIIAEIEKSTDREVSDIMQGARKKVDVSLFEAKKKADQERSAIVSRGDQEARRESQRILAEARIKAKRDKLNAREEMVRISFDRARDKLVRMAQEGSSDGIEYLNVLKRLIKESVKSAGVKSIEVILTVKDKALINQELLDSVASELESDLGFKAQLMISEEVFSGIGGVIVRESDGRVCVDNSFDARIERFRGTVRMRVARELFGQEF